MKTTPEELKTILELHSKWLRKEEGGRQANFIGADLTGTNLRGADLYCADLTGVKK